MRKKNYYKSKEMKKIKQLPFLFDSRWSLSMAQLYEVGMETGSTPNETISDT